MRPRVLLSVQIVAAAAGIVAAMVGCAEATRTGVGTAPRIDAVASGGSIYSLASSGARATNVVYSTQTPSFALDRIDQRELPLDRMYVRAGTGRGVTVYVFDGGVSTTHPELAGRVRVGYTGFPNDPKICNAHGTAVAGAIAGTMLGVAPAAEIVDVKMVQCEKLRGTIQAIVDGAHWVIADHKEHPGPAVANWSFIADTSARIPALDSAVSELRAAGIPVVVSAGNLDIDACRVSPANAKGALVVGASAVQSFVADGLQRTIDRRSPDTAWGPCVDIYAPGDSVLLPSLDNGLRPTQQLWNGTSMSAGYVSGAAALFLESHPTATPDEVVVALKAAATPGVVREARSPETRLLYVGAPQQQLATRTRR